MADAFITKWTLTVTTGFLLYCCPGSNTRAGEYLSQGLFSVPALVKLAGATGFHPPDLIDFKRQLEFISPEDTLQSLQPEEIPPFFVALSCLRNNHCTVRMPAPVSMSQDDILWEFWYAQRLLEDGDSDYQSDDLSELEKGDFETGYASAGAEPEEGGCIS